MIKKCNVGIKTRRLSIRGPPPPHLFRVPQGSPSFPCSLFPASWCLPVPLYISPITSLWPLTQGYPFWRLSSICRNSLGFDSVHSTSRQETKTEPSWFLFFPPASLSTVSVNTTSSAFWSNPSLITDAIAVIGQNFSATANPMSLFLFLPLYRCSQPSNQSYPPKTERPFLYLKSSKSFWCI